MSNSVETPSPSEPESLSSENWRSSPTLGSSFSPTESAPPPPEEDGPPPSPISPSPPPAITPSPTQPPPSPPSPSPPSEDTSPPPDDPPNSSPPTSPPPSPITPPPTPSPPAKSSPPPSPKAVPSPSHSPPPPPPPSSSSPPVLSPPPSSNPSPSWSTPPNSLQSPPPPPSKRVTPPAPDGSPPSPTWIQPPSSSNTPPPPPPPPSRQHQPSSNSSRDSSDSSKASTSPPSGNNGNEDSLTTVKAVMAGVGGVLVIALIAVFFAYRRRRKMKKRAYPPHYMPPKSFAVQNDQGYYYGHSQAPSMGFSGPVNYSYGSQSTHSLHGDVHGSMRGYGGPDSKSFFSYDQVVEMTNGFARQNIIGEGGFGCVYKGWTQDGKTVAVKQLKAGSGQGDREFKAEVEIISRVHHRHLVSLVGYCISDNQRLLIYDFVSNKTLEHHLHAKHLPVLDWSKRLKIAIGSAKGLAYLHEDCHPKIIHRDIKSANILLEDSFEAQVADFGLARLNDTTQTHVSTRVMGTFGYLAPEYASSGKLTDRSDVFSFGVVLLELITGRKPVDPSQPLGDESLVEWARPILIQALETGDLSELVDPRLENQYVESEMMRMVETAAACVRHSGPKRPRMMQVVRSLDSGVDISDLSNGVKFGQSTVYNSGQYSQDIKMFRKIALAGESSEFDTHSGDYTSRDSGVPSSCESTSGESETRAMTKRDMSSQFKFGS